eukprot:COSAG01_NODE_28_length_36622_cov_14.695751_24_plen_51_part_00
MDPLSQTSRSSSIFEANAATTSADAWRPTAAAGPAAASLEATSSLRCSPS